MTKVIILGGSKSAKSAEIASLSNILEQKGGVLVMANTDHIEPTIEIDGVKYRRIKEKDYLDNKFVQMTIALGIATLSRSQRDWVVYEFNKKFEVIE